MNSKEQIRNGANPYGVMLAENINNALPKAKCIYSSGNICLHLPDSVGYKSSAKGWFHTLVETLPEIDAPLERLQVIIYVNEAIECVTIINPSEFDAMAMDNAIADGLSFSSDAPKGWNVPMPLNHPWYSNKGYFKKPSKKNKTITFDDIKDLPNVKPILEEMRKDGIDI